MREGEGVTSKLKSLMVMATFSHNHTKFHLWILQFGAARLQ